MASDTLVIADDIRGISANDVKNIALLEPVAAKHLLAEKLDIAEFRIIDEEQRTLFLSYIYDNIVLAINKGFPWEHVCCVIQFANDFLKRILVDNHQLSDAFQDISEVSEVLAPLSTRHKMQYLDFVYETVLSHYSLYKFVFRHQRKSVRPKVVKTVEVPPTPLPLSQGENMAFWEYNNKIKAIEAREEEAIKQLQQMKKKLQEAASEHWTLDDISQIPLPFTETVLRNLVADILAGFTEKVELELTQKVNEVATALNFKYEKALVPRPPPMDT